MSVFDEAAGVVRAADALGRVESVLTGARDGDLGVVVAVRVLCAILMEAYRLAGGGEWTRSSHATRVEETVRIGTVGVTVEVVVRRVIADLR